jgi:hypothetical protein
MRKLTTLYKSLFLIVLSLIGWTTLRGQEVTVFATHEYGDPGQIVKVKVKVSDFDTMLSTQFTLLYDTAIVEYSAIGDFGIFNITNQNFGVPEGAFPSPKGIITFLWVADNIISGHSMPDSSTLFSISFKITGVDGQISPVEFSDNPTVIEFGNLGGEIDYLAYNGSVTVGEPSSTKEVETEDFIFEPISPNPTQGEANVRFKLLHASKTTMIIHNAAGEEIHRRTQRFGNGLQSLTLGKDLFPAPGVYYISLTTENAQAVQKLIVLQ